MHSDGCAGRLMLAFLLLGMSPYYTTGEQPRMRDFQVVAERIRTEFSGSNADRAKQQRKASGLAPEVAALLDMQNRNQASPLYGAFQEVKKQDDKNINFARQYFDPVRTLARAYSLPASRYYHKKDVSEAIGRALVYTRKHIYPGCKHPGNWWVWAKQMPDCLAEIVGLMSGHLSGNDQSYLLSVLEDLVGTGPVNPGHPHHPGKPGKDALNKFIAGVLTQSPEAIKHARNGMMKHVVPYLLEEDGTPLITILSPENLGISLPYIYEGFRPIITWQRLAHDTSLELEPKAIVPIVRYCLDLGRWNTFRDVEVGWISFTHYRVFWKPAVSRQFAALVADVDPEHTEAIRAFAEGRDNPPEGTRYWPKAETLIFRPPDAYCALVMASQKRHRISWAYKNRHLSIGNKWYYGRDGHLVIARNEHETNPNLTYTTDWQRLSGITRDEGSVLRSRQFEKKTSGYWQPEWILCRNPMAGAVPLDNGDAAAGLEVVSGDLRARKSYYFLKDKKAIIALTSHVKGKGKTETIIHTFPVAGIPEILVSGDSRVPEDGKILWVKTPCWLHVGNAGYYLPDRGKAGVITYVQKPDFEDHPLHEKIRSQVKPQRFVTLFFDHSDSPAEACCASVIFLDAVAKQMPSVVKQFQDEAVYERTNVGHLFSLGAFTGQVFFRPGTMGTLKASGGCILAMQNGTQKPHGGLFNPDWGGVSVEVTVAQGQEVGQTNTFSVKAKAGHTTRFQR